MTNKHTNDWVECELGEVMDINPSLPNKDKIDKSIEVQFLPMKLVEEVVNKIHLTETRIYHDVSKGYTSFIDKDIIFAKVTPCMENGKIAVVNNLKNGIGFGSSEFHVLRCSEKILNSYLYYFIVQNKFRNEAKSAMTGAVGLRRVPKKFIEEYQFPLAPLPIQRAIVAKIEALFSDLDKGIESLRTAQAQLKIYRQAVLKKAFEGGFTITNEELRITNEELRITNEDNQLPNGWKWVKLGEVAEMKAGFFIKASEINEKNDNGLFPCYGGNGLRGYVKSVTHKGMFPIVGRQGALCGNVHLVNGEFHATEHAVVVSVKSDTDIKCLYYKLLEMKLNRYSTGTAQPGLSVNKILPIEILFPENIAEQTAIVQEIEKRLSVADNLELVIRNSIEKAEALRQSILKKAFEGKLLTEAEIAQCQKEPDYEPASKLLEKIKAEKLAKEQEHKKPKKNGK